MATNAEHQKKWRENNPEKHQERVTQAKIKGRERKTDFLNNILDKGSCPCGSTENLCFVTADGKRSNLRSLVHQCISDNKLTSLVEGHIIICKGCFTKNANKKGNERKAQMLGMPYGTACGRLRKQVMFNMAQRLGDDICYRCKQPIESVDVFTIEHKLAWLEQPELFWDIGNIAFSHAACNRPGI